MSGVSLEAYLGALIAVFIIKAGIDMLRENISKILGERADSRLTKEIKDTILEIDGISGAYDLLLHLSLIHILCNGSGHISIIYICHDYWTRKGGSKVFTVLNRYLFF